MWWCLTNKLPVVLLMLFVIGWGVLVAPFDWDTGGLPRSPGKPGPANHGHPTPTGKRGHSPTHRHRHQLRKPLWEHLHTAVKPAFIRSRLICQFQIQRLRLAVTQREINLRPTGI